MQWIPGKALLAIALSLGICFCTDAASSDRQSIRPNILLVVDDMGYTDLDSYGGEIDTPNLDRLAVAGVRFSDFYTAPTCSPTWAMLLSGTDHHPAGLGNMADASIAKYRSPLGGYDILHERRLTAVQARGLVFGQAVAAPRLPGEPAWDQLGAEEKKVASRKMEIYAAMVDDLDRHVGRVFDALEAHDQMDNTLIVFLSDNGAEGHHLDRAVPPLAAYIARCCDNNLATPDDVQSTFAAKLVQIERSGAGKAVGARPVVAAFC